MGTRDRDNKWIRYMLIVVVTTLLLSFVYINSVKQMNRVNIPSFMSFKKNDAQPGNFLILWYAKPSWIPIRGTQHLTGCSFDNCIVTSDKKVLNQSKAVLFHHVQMGGQPPFKSKDQLWGFVAYESPVHTRAYFRKAEWKGKFDFTFSYRTDSEIYSPLGKLVETDQEKELDYLSIYLNKTKEVAWVVSNCNPPSKRMQYVKKMQKEIPVDIFGRCGKKCVKDCFQMISREYKFYLSFENSLCDDYITEKFYRFFDDFDVVLVVRGAPNIFERLPSGSFISSLDFQSPKQLANYLSLVSNSSRLYTNYLKTKRKYRKQFKTNHIQNGMCSLCEKLNKGTLLPKSVDVTTWIQNKSCKKPNDFRK